MCDNEILRRFRAEWEAAAAIINLDELCVCVAMCGKENMFKKKIKEVLRVLLRGVSETKWKKGDESLKRFRHASRISKYQIKDALI